jgi:hypothetical protein
MLEEGKPVPEDDFEESARLYETGQMSRRRFIGRLVAGGASLTAAMALVNATGTAAFAGGGRRRSPTHYGKAPCHYGDAPGHYGKPPGQYGNPPGQYGNPPGHYGKPPGQYGNPPGHYGKPPRRHEDHDRDRGRGRSGSRGRR